MFTSIILIVLAQQAVPMPETSSTRPLTGLVVDAESKPIEGAEVWLAGLARFGAKTPVLSRTVTDAQGHFRLIFPPDKDGRRAREARVSAAVGSGNSVSAQRVTVAGGTT